MPMRKKDWLTIGNSLLGIWIACTGVFTFCLLPYWATRDLMPYTKTVAGAMKPLFYGPYLIPAVTIALTAMCYYRFKRDIQQTAISLALLMFLIPFATIFFYWGGEKGFLDHYIVYQGNCEAINISVSTEGNRKNLYADFTCGNDPSQVFKVWDPDIIAYVANHPAASPRQYQLSANHTLLPIEPLQTKK
jgi:hypothetical protein